MKLGIVVVGLGALGCASPQARTHAAEHAYRDEMLLCVAEAGTLEESRACRARVRERWGVDAGADE